VLGIIRVQKANRVSRWREGYIAVQKTIYRSRKEMKIVKEVPEPRPDLYPEGVPEACNRIVSYRIVSNHRPIPIISKTHPPSKVRIQTFEKTGKGILNHAVNLETGEVHAAELFVDTLLLGLRGLSNVFL
jgi:hypothetical protein